MPAKFNAIFTQFSPVYTVKYLKILFNIILTPMVPSLHACLKDIQLKNFSKEE
jgi:hypothetical protein